MFSANSATLVKTSWSSQSARSGPTTVAVWLLKEGCSMNQYRLVQGSGRFSSRISKLVGHIVCATHSPSSEIRGGKDSGSASCSASNDLRLVVVVQ